MNDDPTGAQTSNSKLYAERDHYALSPHFEHHMLALTGERLESKSAIAAELAHRDAEIERLTCELAVQKGVNDLAYIPHRALVESRDGLQKRYDKVEAERDRLRAALLELVACKALREKIDGELSACHQEMSPQLQALENEYQLRKPLAWRDARAALSGEPTSAVETKACPVVDLDAEQGFEAGWRAATSWTDRDDLLSDIGSSAYHAAMTEEFERLMAKPIPQREGDNRDVSAERCRNTATVSGTPESYSCSDPSADARTPAGAGIASPVVTEEPSVMGAGAGSSPMPTALDAIGAHVREIQMLCDACGADPAEWLSDNAAQGETGDRTQLHGALVRVVLEAEGCPPDCSHDFHRLALASVIRIAKNALKRTGSSENG